jgi:hypothetical protein
VALADLEVAAATQTRQGGLELLGKVLLAELEAAQMA